MDWEMGRWRVKDLLLDRFRLDGGAMFGVVPKTLWSVVFPPDEDNRISLVSRALLLEDGTRKILVDTGMGSRWSPRERERMGIDSSRSLQEALAERSCVPEDITDVLLTHLHFDHAGGAVSCAADGSLIPTFPNAIHHVQRANLEWARAPTARDRGSYRPGDFEPLVKSGRVRLLDGPEELFPGIQVRLSDGHATGLQIPVISGGGSVLVYPADLVPTHAHLPLAWAMSYDLRPLQVLAEKQALLNQAVEEDWIVFYEHDPGLVASRVRLGSRGFVASEGVEMEA